MMNNIKDEKGIKLSFSLLMRLLEWSKEEAKSDVDLRKVIEKLMAFNDGVNPLNMDVYDCLIADVPHDDYNKDEEDNGEYASEDDLNVAYNIGQDCQDVGCDLDNVAYSDAGQIITDIKDNGYGASNAELEKFWNGYEKSRLDPECVIACEEEPTEDEEYDNEIKEIINLGRF